MFKIPGRLLDIDLSIDGKKLLTSLSRGNICVWDYQTGKEAEWYWETPDTRCVRFSPDSQSILVATMYHGITVIDCLNKDVRIIWSIDHQPFSVVCSPDGRTIASGGWDGTIRFWDFGSGEHLGVIKEHSGPITCVDYSPDGQRIVCGSDDHTVRVWEVATRKCIKVLYAHDRPVKDARWSPDGHSIVSADKKHIHVWSTHTWERVYTRYGVCGGLVSFSIFCTHEKGGMVITHSISYFTLESILIYRLYTQKHRGTSDPRIWGRIRVFLG